MCIKINCCFQVSLQNKTQILTDFLTEKNPVTRFDRNFDRLFENFDRAAAVQKSRKNSTEI